MVKEGEGEWDKVRIREIYDVNKCDVVVKQIQDACDVWYDGHVLTNLRFTKELMDTKITAESAAWGM